jgi:hypothetical protein
MSRTVVVATRDLTGEARDLLQQAARDLGVEVVAAAPRGVPKVGSAARVHVAGWLPRGRRHVPKRMAALAAALPGSPELLLLCDEPLAADAVRVDAGRIVMVGQPLTAAKIAGALRGDAPALACRGDAAVREFWGRGYWGATIDGAAADAPEVFTGSGRTRGAVVLRGGGGAKTAAAEFAAGNGSLDDVAGQLGPDCAAVGVDLLQRSWLVHLPDGTRGFLLSRQRLPNVFALPATTAPRLLGALEGDVVVLTGGRWQRSDLLERTVDLGGRALVEELLRDADGLPASLPLRVLEVA